MCFHTQLYFTIIESRQIANTFHKIIGLTNAYARGAKQNGATIIEDFPINEIVIDQDRKGNKRIKAVKSEKGYVCHQFC